MTKVETVSRMKTMLLERGWTQGQFEDKSGKVCILGALNRCTSLRSLAWYIQVDMDTELDYGTAAWNDMNGRTFNEVMDFLDRMTLKYKEKLSGG